MGYAPRNDGFQQLNVCGIAAILLHPQKRSAEQWQAIRQAFRLNLIFNEQRGPAATGVAVMDTDGMVALCKRPLPASAFTETLEYRQALERVGRRTSLILGHTRLPTKGDPLQGTNNHPIRAGAVVGVHNGHIANDDELFLATGFERRGEVDSEIVFRLLEGVRPGIRAGRYLDQVRQRIELLQGEYTFMACDQRRPEQLLVLRDGNPLCAHFTKDWNAVVFSSRYAYLRFAFGPACKIESLPSSILMLYDAAQLAVRGCSPSFAMPLRARVANAE